MATCITLIICFTAMVVTIPALYMAYTDKFGRSVYELIFGRKTPKKDEKTEV